MKRKILSFIIGLMQLAMIIELIAAVFTGIKNYFFTSDVNLSRFLFLDLLVFVLSWAIGVTCYEKRKKR